MSRKVLQIGYEPERDRLTWDGWDIHCGHDMEVLLPDQLGGGTWRAVSFEYNDEGWYVPGYTKASSGDNAKMLSAAGSCIRNSQRATVTVLYKFMFDVGYLVNVR